MDYPIAAIAVTRQKSQTFKKMTISPEEDHQLIFRLEIRLRTIGFLIGCISAIFALNEADFTGFDVQ